MFNNRGTIHGGRTINRRGTIHKLYTKVLHMQYQEGDYAWGEGGIYRRGTINIGCIHGIQEGDYAWGENYRS